LLLLIFISSGFLFGCARKTQSIVLAGSTAFQPFAEKLAEVYMEKHPNVTIDVQGGGSALGIMTALQGIVDIGMADMVKLPKEADPLTKTIVAMDGIAIIVNEKNSISKLTSIEAQKVFSGDITDWSQLGPKKGNIRVISREDGSGTRKSFDKLVLGKIKLTKNAMYQDSNGTIREAIKSDPNSIGYISIGFLIPGVKPLVFDGVAPTNENVKKGIYKIFRPVYFLTNGEPGRLAQKFINFMLSDEAQSIIKKDGLISIK